MTRTWRWAITIVSAITSFLGTWALGQGVLGWDSGSAQAIAGLMATVFTLPLGWWAALDQPAVPAPPGTGVALPRAWRVPIPRNREFVGRDEILEALHQALVTGGTAAVQALRGMGGIGKTQVAAEYAYRNAARYRIVWWIAAEEPSLIGEQLDALSTVLGLSPPGDSGTHVTALVTRHLREHDDWLLIFDNAETPTDVERLLAGGQGHTIITSRGGHWGHLAATIDVGELSRSESVALLRTANPQLSSHEADRLAEALSDLPLALVQAAGFIASSGADVGEYLEFIAGDPALVLEHGPSGSHAGCLTATVALSARRAAELDPAALGLLRACASLGAEPIPIEWLISWPGDHGETGSALILRRNVGHLRDLGLVVAAESSVQLHRLTRMIVAGLMTDDERAEARRRAERILCANRPADTDDPLVWPQWALLLPHLLALDPSSTQSAGLRDLACHACRYLLRQGDIAAGYDLAQNIYRAWSANLGPDHPDTLAAANQLANAFELKGEYAQARRLAEQTLVRRRRTLGEDHPDTLLVAGRTAVYLYYSGEYELARQLNVDTLARRTRVLGVDHPDTLRTAANLAPCLRAVGEFDAARHVGDDAFARRQRVLGDDHPDTLGSAANRAFNFRHLGDFDRARRIDEDILARRRRVLGEDHPDTLLAASGLAASLHAAGDYARARQLNEDALEGLRGLLGDDHPQTLNVAIDLTASLYALGDHQRARRLHEETLERLRRRLGDDHPHTVRAANDLAVDRRPGGD